MPPRPLRLVCLALLGCWLAAAAQAQNGASNNVKRVTVSQNNDGSRTTYKVDGEARKTVATTVGRDGKVQSRIRYDLDDAGRFSRGEVYGPNDQLRFKTQYKYDTSGQLQEEIQFTADGVMKNRLAYSYDKLTGRQTGYAVYDSAGKIVGRSTAGAPASANAPVPREKLKR